MSSRSALFICVLIILWLFRQDIRRKPDVSPALWIAVIWVAILGSRPVSAWLGLEGSSFVGENEAEGSPVDRNVFLLLLISAFIVLSRRNVKWRALFASNRWLLFFYLFFAL